MRAVHGSGQSGQITEFGGAEFTWWETEVYQTDFVDGFELFLGALGGSIDFVYIVDSLNLLCVDFNLRKKNGLVEPAALSVETGTLRYDTHRFEKVSGLE